MLSPARILIRETTACGGASPGNGTARRIPSTRIRTTSPVRNGSMWMSLARSSIARSSTSLTARTTGAPLARSRRLSMSSSPERCSGSSTSTSPVVRSSSRSSRTVAMSSKDATAIVTGRPQTISAALIVAPSAGSATAKPKPSSPARNGETEDSRKNRGEKCSTAPITFISSCRPRRGNLQNLAASSANFPAGRSDFSHISLSPFPGVASTELTPRNFTLAASGIRSSKCRRNCSTECFEVATVTLSTADDLARLGTDFDMSLLRSAALHICRFEIEHHAGFNLDRTSLLDIGFEFPLAQGLLDVSPLHRRGAYHVNMLHTAVRRHDHSYRDRYGLRADVIRLHPVHNIFGGRIARKAFRNGIGRFLSHRREIVERPHQTRQKFGILAG